MRLFKNFINRTGCMLLVLALLLGTAGVLPARAANTGYDVSKDDVYAVRIFTGEYAGDQIGMIALHYISGGKEYCEYIDRNDDMIKETAELAARLDQENGQASVFARKKEILSAFNYEIPEIDKYYHGFLESDSHDTFFIHPGRKIDSLTSVEVITDLDRENSGEKKWTCAGVTLSKVDKIYGCDMEGYISNDLQINYDGRMIARTVIPHGKKYAEIGLSPSQLSPDSIDGRDTAFWITTEGTSQGEKSVYIENFKKKQNVTAGQAVNVAVELDLADFTGAGIEAYTNLANASEDATFNMSLAQFLKFIPESLSLEVAYFDSNGIYRKVSVPVVTSSLAFAYDQSYIDVNTRLADYLGQGENLLLYLTLYDFDHFDEKGIRTSLTYDPVNVEKYYSMTGKEIQEQIRTPIRDKIAQENDQFNLAGAAVYEDIGIDQIHGAVNGALLRWTFDPDPSYIYRSKKTKGMPIQPSNEMAGHSFKMKKYEDPEPRLPAEETEDTYVVEISTAGGPLAATLSDLSMSLRYISKDDEEILTTDEISLREACSRFYGYWPGGLGDEERTDAPATIVSPGTSAGTGLDGTNAETGPDGMNAEAGPDGTNAGTGLDGMNAEAGPDGTNAEAGPDGTNAEAGPDGTNAGTGLDEMNIEIGDYISMLGEQKDLAYEMNMKTGGRLYALVTIPKVYQFTGISLNLKGDDPWQMTGFAIYKLGDEGIGARHVKWENCYNGHYCSNRIIYRDYNAPLHSADPEGDAEIARPGATQLIEMTGLSVYLDQEKNSRSLEFVSKTLVEEDDYKNWRTLYKDSMPHEITQHDLGFTRTAMTYHVCVTTGSEDEALKNEDCGSKNRFYFQLQFENGASAYVLANQQLQGDGFVAGSQAEFDIAVNQNYGNLTGIHVIPDDTASDADPYDRLKIQAIKVSVASLNGSRDIWEAKIKDHNCWVGIDYQEEGEAGGRDSRQARNVRSYRTTYQVGEKHVMNSYLVAVNTDSSVDRQFIPAKLKAIFKVRKRDGSSDEISIDALKAIYAFKDENPGGLSIDRLENDSEAQEGLTGSDDQSLDGQSSDTKGNEESTGKAITVWEPAGSVTASNPDSMFRAGKYDCFILEAEDVDAFTGVCFDAQGATDCDWSLNSVTIARILTNHGRQVSVTGDTMFKGKTEMIARAAALPEQYRISGNEKTRISLKLADPENSGKEDSDDGQSDADGLQTGIDSQSGTDELQTGYDQGQTGIDGLSGSDGLQTGYDQGQTGIDSQSGSGSDQTDNLTAGDYLNIAVFMEKNGEDLSSYKMTGSIQYAAAFDRYYRVTPEFKRVEANGRTVYYANGLSAANLQAVDSIYLKADFNGQYTGKANVSWAEVQRVRKGMVINTYRFACGSTNVVHGTYFNQLTEKDAGNEYQVVNLKLGAQTTDTSQSEELVPESRDLAVAIRYKSVSGNTSVEHLSDFVYLTSQGIRNIKPNQLVSFRFFEEEIDEITGIVVAANGSGLVADVESASAGCYRKTANADINRNLMTQTREGYVCSDWYSVAKGGQVTDNVASFTADHSGLGQGMSIVPMRMKFHTMEGNETLQNMGTTGDISMLIKYVGTNGQDYSYTITNIRDYLEAGSFNTGEDATIAFMGQDMTRISTITFRCYDNDAATNLTWGLESFIISYGDGAQVPDNKITVNQVVYEENRVSTSDASGNPGFLTNQDGLEVGVKNVNIQAAASVYNPTTGKTSDLVAGNTGYGEIPVISLQHEGDQVRFKVDISNSNKGAKVTAGQYSESDANSYLSSDTSTMVTFKPPTNLGRDATYTIRFRANENPMAMVAIKVFVSADIVPETTTVAPSYGYPYTSSSYPYPYTSSTYPYQSSSYPYPYTSSSYPYQSSSYPYSSAPSSGPYSPYGTSSGSETGSSSSTSNSDGETKPTQQSAPYEGGGATSSQAGQTDGSVPTSTIPDDYKGYGGKSKLASEAKPGVETSAEEPAKESQER